MLEKTLESPLDCKGIKPVNPKGNLSWILIVRADVEAETPILLTTWSEELTHLKRPWCWERLKAGEGDVEDEMARRHHRLDVPGSEQALGVGDGQGSLVYCSPWVSKESDMAEWLDWRLDWGWRRPTHMAVGRSQFLAGCNQMSHFLPHWVLHRADHDVVAGLFQSAFQREREGNQVVNGSAMYSQCWKWHP